MIYKHWVTIFIPWYIDKIGYIDVINLIVNLFNLKPYLEYKSLKARNMKCSLWLWNKTKFHFNNLKYNFQCLTAVCLNVTDEAEKAGGMRTRLSTGSIHLNGTTTIAVAREIENNQRLQGKSPKDVVGVWHMFSCSFVRVGGGYGIALVCQWVKNRSGCNRSKNYIGMSVVFWLFNSL